MNKTQVVCRQEAGFTLVELAIVMIIIGLLIGGVLKGQQLVINAEIVATCAEIKAIEAATTAFRDQYNALPGDMLNPAARLPNCAAAPCNIGGDGDGVLDTDPSLDHSPPGGGEGMQFFVHLAAAGYLARIAPSGPPNVWGSLQPSMPIGGGLWAGSSMGTFRDFDNLIGTTLPDSGLYLTTCLYPANFVAQPDAALTAGYAARIDRKIDDGSPGSGSVRAADVIFPAAAYGGTVAPNNCAASGTTYAENIVGPTACNLFIRIGN